MENNDTVTLKDGRTVGKIDYVRAKTADLVEFGYENLTEDQLLAQLDKVLSGSTDLSVIGGFVSRDIDLAGCKTEVR